MANTNTRWSLEDLVNVNKMLIDGHTLNNIALTFQRTNNSILWQAIKFIKKNNYIPKTYNISVYKGLMRIPDYSDVLLKIKTGQPIYNYKNNTCCGGCNCEPEKYYNEGEEDDEGEDEGEEDDEGEDEGEKDNEESEIKYKLNINTVKIEHIILMLK